MTNEKIRNVAIIAHVDHGKTSLVNEMLKQTHLKEREESQFFQKMPLAFLVE